MDRLINNFKMNEEIARGKAKIRYSIITWSYGDKTNRRWDDGWKIKSMNL